MSPDLPDADGLLPVVPAGALRILARNDDREILIVHGEDRGIGDGERLVFIDWLPSIAAAEAASHFCSIRLGEARFPPDKNGWHRFPVEHLSKLLANAKTHLNVTYHPTEVRPPQHERQDWTNERCAWLAVLITRGWTAKRIAADPLIHSTERMVYKQAYKLGLSFATAPSETGHLRLPVPVAAAYDRAAERQGLTRDAYIRRFLIASADRLDQLVAA